MSAENVRILLFHRVSPVRDKLWDPMDPALFEEIISWVDKNYTVFSLEDFFFKERSRLKKPPVIITFDDGYHDFLDYSFPVLQRYKMPASLFVVTDCIDQNRPTWTYQLDHLFLNTTRLNTLPSPVIPGFKMKESWATAQERIHFGNKLKQQLKRTPAKIRNEVLKFYNSQFDDVHYPEKTMLSWDELKFLSKNGIEIGSHTVTHPPLATITDEVVLEDELIRSGMRIREEIGTFPAAISYPVGSYNNRVKNLAHRVGYKLGLAVDQKIYNEDKHGRYSIPRLELYNESLFKSKLRIKGTISKLKSLVGR